MKMENRFQVLSETPLSQVPKFIIQTLMDRGVKLDEEVRSFSLKMFTRCYYKQEFDGYSEYGEITHFEKEGCQKVYEIRGYTESYKLILNVYEDGIIEVDVENKEKKHKH